MKQDQGAGRDGRATQEPIVLEVRGLSKRFVSHEAEVHAVEGISLSVRRGEFLTIVGPSGCGKSTILSMIAGFEPPDAGEIMTEGRPVTGPSPERVMVFQDLGLFPWLTVEGNVRFGLERTGLAPAEIDRRVRTYLDLVHLWENRGSLMHQLSGGMKQRVSLARALAMEPKFLLMDEPFSSLDSHTRERLQGELQELWEKTWCTFVFVTHGLKEAVALGDRVILLSARPGRIQREIRVDLPRPRSVDDAPVLKIAKELRAGISSWVDPVTRAEESL